MEEDTRCHEVCECSRWLLIQGFVRVRGHSRELSLITCTQRRYILMRVTLLCIHEL